MERLAGVLPDQSGVSPNSAQTEWDDPFSIRFSYLYGIAWSERHQSLFVATNTVLRVFTGTAPNVTPSL
jgi:hypothetical protein